MNISSLLFAVLVPSIFMAFGANFLNLSNNFQTILEAFTAGLLVISGASLLHGIEEKPFQKLKCAAGFISAIALIYIMSNKLTGGILTSLYFDSMSDGLLLGTMLTKLGSIKNLLPVIIPMTIEMMITASSSVSILNLSGKTDNVKPRVTLAAVILAVAILCGGYLGKFLNKEYVVGFGAASMLWLGLCEFIPEIVKNIKSQQETNTANLAIFTGMLSGMFFDTH